MHVGMLVVVSKAWDLQSMPRPAILPYVANKGLEMVEYNVSCTLFGGCLILAGGQVGDDGRDFSDAVIGPITLHLQNSTRG